MTDDQAKLLDELLDSDGDELNEYELEFLNGLDNNRDVELTGQQEDKLNRLWSQTFP
jgi:hypothetical protein